MSFLQILPHAPFASEAPLPPSRWPCGAALPPAGVCQDFPLRAAARLTTAQNVRSAARSFALIAPHAMRTSTACSLRARCSFAAARSSAAPQKLVRLCASCFPAQQVSSSLPSACSKNSTIASRSSNRSFRSSGAQGITPESTPSTSSFALHAVKMRKKEVKAAAVSGSCKNSPNTASSIGKSSRS